MQKSIIFPLLKKNILFFCLISECFLLSKNPKSVVIIIFRKFFHLPVPAAPPGPPQHCCCSVKVTCTLVQTALSRVPLRFQRATTCSSTLYLVSLPPQLDKMLMFCHFSSSAPTPPAWSGQSSTEAQCRLQILDRFTFIWKLSTPYN